jgi:hypothetical protein
MDRRREVNVKTEAEVGVMQSQPRNGGSHWMLEKKEF